jgi:TPR repeat protein
MNSRRRLVIGSIFFGLVCLGLGGWFLDRKSDGHPDTTAPIVDVAQTRSQAVVGNAEAQLRLGRLYAHGEEVGQSYNEAAQWYRRAAEQGYAPAQTALGQLYEAGRGVPHDVADAAIWYRRAADQGHAPAQYDLAVLYLMGTGVPQSTPEALKWYRKSADRGWALAQYNLGMRYYEGKDVARDPIQAYSWLSLADAQGIPDAARTRDALAQTMTGEQIKEARSRVQSFRPKQP